MSAFNDYGLRTTGKTPSQRSIYDYPEHLNPFYEDENHKRLRFWKINNGSEKKKSNRRSSFSLNGLRGLWSFKSFRLNKRSSTLGINKTSESPPLPRRDDDDRYDTCSMNPQMRHTVSVGLSNNFNRGTSYRSSLQHIPSSRETQNLFFVRQHRYRNTIQSPPPESPLSQSYGGTRSVTPTLRSKYGRGCLSHGISQTSINSSNPFEDDYVETISQVGSIDGASPRRTPRKKRRAPQPPTSPLATPNNAITTVNESSNEIAGINDNCDESMNITNLSAEIQSFVKTADTDDDHIKTTSTILRIDEEESKTNGTKSERESPENNNYYTSENSGGEVVTTDKIHNLGNNSDLDIIRNSERRKISPVKILIRAPTEEDDDEDDAETKCTNKQCEEIPKTVEEKNQQQSNEIPAEVKIEDAKPEQENANESISSVTINEKHIYDDFQNARSSTPTSTEVECILERNNSQEVPESPIGLLHITESNENLTKIEIDTNGIASTSPEKPKIGDKPKFEVRRIPLKESSPQPIQQQNTKDEFFAIDSDENDVILRKNGQMPPTPPRRRRSVKEIIESINKSQSLLKMNQDQKQQNENKIINLNTIPQFVTKENHNNNFSNRNINDAICKMYQEKKMFSDVNEVNNNNHQSNSNGNANDVENNNEILFKKCIVRKDDNINGNGSVAKIDNEKANVEWNPVPKPRRHRHSAQGTIN